MRTFTTESGSTYQLDEAQSRIRRLEGKGTATPRQGPDGEWKAYSSIVGPMVGQSCVIVWRVDVDGQGPVFRTTMTSAVKLIEEMMEA